MKLLRLYLGNYRVLRDLEIRFGPPTKSDDALPYIPSYALDFLVGVNGTGKSTVLYAVADLVRKLERSAPIPFPFEIEYEIGFNSGKRVVKLSNRADDPSEEGPQQTGLLCVSVNGEPIEQFSNDLLPMRIVAFTTGSEAEWEPPEDEDMLSKGDPDAVRKLSALDQAIRELPGKPPRLATQEQDQPLQPSRFLLIRAQHLSIVTLCGLLVDLSEEERAEERRLRQVLEQAKLGDSPRLLAEIPYESRCHEPC